MITQLALLSSQPKRDGIKDVYILVPALPVVCIYYSMVIIVTKVTTV